MVTRLEIIMSPCTWRSVCPVLDDSPPGADGRNSDPVIDTVRDRPSYSESLRTVMVTVVRWAPLFVRHTQSYSENGYSQPPRASSLMLRAWY